MQRMPATFYLNQWTSLPSLPKGDLLRGKTAIITGANVGIGFETALHLASFSPAKLILAVRNLAAGAEAVEKLLKKYPKTVVDVWQLDVSKYASVKAFAERAQKELKVVDILINNAGQNPGFKDIPLNRTEDGHEQTIQVNVLAPILLTLLLQPLMAKSADPRNVIVSSDGHFWAKTDLVVSGLESKQGVLATFDDDGQYVNSVRYFQSKLLLQMIVRKLIPALPGTTIVSANPGMARTTLLRDMPPLFSWMVVTVMPWFLLNSRSAEAGARNITTAAVLATDSIEYWHNCGPGASESLFLGTKTGFQATEKLWTEVLEEMERVAPGSTKSLQL